MSSETGNQETLESGGSTQSTAGKPPSEPAVGNDRTLWVVLLEVRYVGGTNEEKTRYEYLGTVATRPRTQRSTVLQHVREEGKVAIPLDDGETGTLHVVPAVEFGEGVPLVARRKLVFEVVHDDAT